MDDLIFRFPTPPPRRRTALEPLFAPIRWLLATAIIAALLSFWTALWLLWGVVLVGVHIGGFFLWRRFPYMLRRHLLRWPWLWTRQGRANLCDWAFARRV